MAGAANVVEILVKSTNDTGAGFGEAKAGAAETAAAMDEYAAAATRAEEAQTELAGAQAKLDEAQAGGKATAEELSAAEDEYAAALDRASGAALASMDAQIKLGRAELEASGNAKLAGDASEEAGTKAETSGGLMAGMGGKAKMALLGVAVGAGLAVKGAADFQQQTVRLVTSAGESAKNLGLVQRGILSLSSATNTSTSQLSSGMYMVESAGFHGANGLTVLKAAAQGAAAEGADLGDVANAVTSGLNAYGMKASQATSFTNQMVTAVGRGKMTMQDLSSSLSAVLPIAASAHISFAQVGGGIATMTAQGMSARQASQDLAFSIRSLLKPSSVASQQMRAMGLNALDVSKNLGKVGLTGTMQELSDAVLRNTKGGTVFLNYMKNMTPAAQGVARQILAGTINTKQLRQAVYGLNPEQAKLISLFDASATSATGLKQTYAGAMSAMTGGATGLNTSLMLTGSHMKTFESNTRAIAGSAKHAGSNVKGWSQIQKETNFQLGSAGKAIIAMGDSLGLALLPSVTAILKPLTSLLGVIGGNKAASIALAVVVGGVLAGALGGKLANAFTDTKKGLSAMADGIGKLLVKMGLMTAATDEQAAATGEAEVAQDGLNLSMLANPIFLIIAAIAILVVAFVELWKHCAAFRDFWKDAWRDVRTIVSDAVEFIKAHWKLLVAIILGPLGIVLDLVISHFDQIKHLVTDLVDWVRSHWQLLATILATVLLGPIGGLVVFIATHWQEIRSETGRLIGDVVRFFETLPGRIMGAIASLPGKLFSFGAHIVSMLASGIASAVGSVTSAIGHIAGDILDHIPHSPAKKGPLSGRGDPRLGGLRIGQMLAEGLADSTGAVNRAASRMAGATVPRPGLAGAGAYGHGMPLAGRLQLELMNNGGDAGIITALRKAIRVRGGLQKALGP